MEGRGTPPSLRRGSDRPRGGKLLHVADRGVRAPAWLEELVRTGRPAVPWPDVVRFAVGITGPLVLVALLGLLDDPAGLGAGVFGTTGALAVTLAPQGGPLRTRMRRVVAAGGFGALGLVAGEAASGEGWGPVLVVGLLSALAALISSIDAALSLGALQLLVYTALSSGLQTDAPLAGRDRVLRRRRRCGPP